MLGRLRMNVDEAIAAYAELADKVFMKKALPINFGSSFWRMPWNYRVQGRFDSEALKQAIIQFVEKAEEEQNEFMTEEAIEARNKIHGHGADTLLKDDSENSCKV